MYYYYYYYLKLAYYVLHTQFDVIVSRSSKQVRGFEHTLQREAGGRGTHTLIHYRERLVDEAHTHTHTHTMAAAAVLAAVLAAD